MGFHISINGILTGIKIATGVALKAEQIGAIRMHPEDSRLVDMTSDYVEAKLARRAAADREQQAPKPPSPLDAAIAKAQPPKE